MALPTHLASVDDAIAIAVDVARELGFPGQEPVPLRSTNNAVAWLRPADIVAKVSATSDSRLPVELQVAQELRALGAPIVPPASGLPAVVHRRGRFDVTFWTYRAHSDIEPSPMSVAHALNELHNSLDRLSPALRTSLPGYMEELLSVRSLLADPAAIPALASADRELLMNVFDTLKTELDLLAPASTWVVLHGSPHAYNVLAVDGAPAFIDFETTCLGPRDWDFAHLDTDAEQHVIPFAQPELLSLCQKMVTVKTAILCSAEIDRGDMREHAEYHLALIRDNFGAASPLGLMAGRT